MKKIIFIALFSATTSLMAMYAEHAYLYKDPSVMSMGGANVAVGASSTAVFSNPAGLTNIKKDDGFVVDVLGLGVSASPDVMNFVSDFDAANGDVTAVGNVLKAYAGEHFHGGVDNYSSISKNSEVFAWSIGLLAAGDLNLMTHSDLSLETSSRAYGGVVVGAAKPYETEFGQLDVGMSVKVMSVQSYSDTISAADLIGTTDLMADITDKLVAAQGVGFDLGVVYKPFADSFWHPAIGFSVLNIGSIDMDGAYGGQPTTVNLGLSLTPELPFFDKFVFAVDYVDALNANVIRMYNSDGTYDDYEEADFMKRFRAGIGMGLIDNTFMHLTLNAGIYQAAPTAGVDLTIALFKLNVSTYQENVGTTNTPIEDRRVIGKIAFGW